MRSLEDRWVAKLESLLDPVAAAPPELVQRYFDCIERRLRAEGGHAEVSLEQLRAWQRRQLQAGRSITL